MAQRIIIVKAVALFVGIISVAAATGYIAGGVENIYTVAAAVISSLFAVFLGWFIFAARSDAIEPSILAGLGAFVFSLTFLIFMWWKIEAVQNEDKNALPFDLNARKILHEQLHERHLEWCSKLEFRINYQREIVGLPPLSSEIVCGNPYSLGQNVDSRSTKKE